MTTKSVQLREWQYNSPECFEPQGECQHKYLIMRGKSLFDCLFKKSETIYCDDVCVKCGVTVKGGKT